MRRRWRALVAALAVAAALPVGQAGAAPGAWTRATDPLFPTNGNDKAILLDGPNCAPRCGQVLLIQSAGAAGVRGELYNPASGAWAATPPLPDGGAAIYAATLIRGSFATCGANCGRVLSLHQGSWFLYDPPTNTWTAAAPPNQPSQGAGSTQVGNSKVVMVGADATGHATEKNDLIYRRTELFNPRTGLWEQAAPRRYGSGFGNPMVTLVDGRALAVGGFVPEPGVGNPYIPAGRGEVYDPNAGPLGTWTETGPSYSSVSHRQPGSLTRLVDGQVLAVYADGVTEIYDPATNAWSRTGTCPACGFQVSTVLPTGKVLSVGTERKAYLFDPRTGMWAETGSLHTARSQHGAALLSGPNCAPRCGMVLVGPGGGGTTAELYLTGPLVTGVSPASGPTAGGTAVTISGSGFVAGASSVRFGETPAPGTSVGGGGTTISVTSPPHAAGPVHVTVTTPGGTSEVSDADVFTYVGDGPAPTPDAPVVGGVSPDCGPSGGGTEVTISGTGLGSTSQVRFGTTAVAPRQVTDTFVKAISPSGSGAVDVVVTTPGGTSAAGAVARFSYPCPPAPTPGPGGGPPTPGTDREPTVTPPPSPPGGAPTPFAGPAPFAASAPLGAPAPFASPAPFAGASPFAATSPFNAASPFEAAAPFGATNPGGVMSSAPTPGNAPGAASSAPGGAQAAPAPGVAGAPDDAASSVPRYAMVADPSPALPLGLAGLAVLGACVAGAWPRRRDEAAPRQA